MARRHSPSAGGRQLGWIVLGLLQIKRSNPALLRSSRTVPDLPGLLTPIAGVRPPSTLFGLVLLVHIPAGATAVINGLIAGASPKRRGRHPNAGRIYVVALSVVFVTATAMAAMRWSEDAYLSSWDRSRSA